MTEKRLILETERLALRPPRLDDAAAIFRNYAQDHEVTRYLVWRPHNRVEETASFLHNCLGGWGSGREFTWVVTLVGSDEPIGMVACRRSEYKADIGYVLARKYWGQGIMTEAASRVVNWIFALPEVYRVWAVCDVGNPASARVLENLGMVREGILRRWIVHPNVSHEPRDCFVYASVK